MKFNEHDILQKIGPILMSPRVVPSKAELARRAKLTDDMLLRFDTGFSLERGFNLLDVENGKVKLTEKGRLAYELYSKIWSLGDGEDCPKQTLKLQVESVLGALLWAALASVFQLWGSAINRPSIWRLDGDIRRCLLEKKVDLGFGFGEEGDSISEDEKLGLPVQWCVLAPAGHQIGETQEAISAAQLPKEDWLLVPDLAFGANGLADSIARAGHKQVVECDQPVEHVGTGFLSLLPDVFGSGSQPGMIKRRFLGLPALQVRLFLPRGREALSSASQCLVENLRRLAQGGLSGSDNTAVSAIADSCCKELVSQDEDEEVVEPFVEEPAPATEGALS